MPESAHREGAGRRLVRWIEERFNLTEIFSFLTNFGLFPTELDTRLPLSQALDEALRRPLPSYARWPRVLGVLSFLLFLFLAITGVMLAFYYQPTASEAFASVTSIVRDVSFGWFVHQAHRWGAHLLLLMLLARVVRFYFQGLYKTPREALWILAVLIFLVATHADLTGRLLPWDGRGYWTSVRALETLYAVPILGPAFAFLVGGPSIDALVLTRFYILHVFVLPALLLVLFFLNFSSVRRVGLSPLPGATPAGAAVFRAHLYNLLILTVLAAGALITLATLLPTPYGAPADPYVTVTGARPPWYLLAPHALLESLPRFLPAFIRGLLVLAFLGVVLLLPFIDRAPWQPAGRRRLAIGLGVAVIVLTLLLTWQGYLLEAAR